jgi:hypothetical protein
VIVHHSDFAAPQLGPPFLGARIPRLAVVAQFELVAWWYTREEIGQGLREYYGPGDDLPPRLQLLISRLDKPRSSWLANLCVLGFICAMLAVSFRFHFVF